MKNYSTEIFHSETGEQLAYRQAGTSGPALLLIHGNMSSSVHFQPLIRNFEKTCRVYAVDLPGFGDSTYNRQINSLKDFSKDIESFILDKDLTDLSILGWSTGGGVALETAAALPDRIKTVYLLNSVGIKGYPMYKKGEDLQPILTERIYKREDIENDPVQVLPVIQAFEEGNKDLIKTIWEASIYHLNLPQKKDYDQFIDAVMKQRNLVDVDVALTQFNITQESNGVVDGSGIIDEIQSDIVIIHGAQDMVVPVQDAIDTKAAFGEQAHLEIIEDAGHSIMTDDLEKLTATIKNYLIK